MESIYPHDLSFAVVEGDGKLVLGGGCDSNIGVGQSFEVESYDPSTRTFLPMQILDEKRTWASASLLENGKIVVSGNWYNDDGIEVYDPSTGTFKSVKKTSAHRSAPYLLPTSPDNAIIFSSTGSRGEYSDWKSGREIVDRLEGEPFEVPLLGTYRPMRHQGAIFTSSYTIGDYTYMIPACDSLGKMSLLLIREEEFSLIETSHPIPGEFDGKSIEWTSIMLTDPGRKVSYLFGKEADVRGLYLLEIHYEAALRGESVPVRLLYTGSLESPGGQHPALLEDGSIVAVGGSVDDNYFTPYSSAYALYPLGSPRKAFPVTALAFALALLLAGALLLAFLRYRKGAESDAGNDEDTPGDILEESIPAAINDTDLMQEIVSLLEGKKLYLRKGLKLSDLATELGTNTKYISACINKKAGCSFTDLVNRYRIAYAKQLLLENPDLKLFDVGEMCGFSSETSFFRNFKTLEGKSPSQWLSDIKK